MAGMQYQEKTAQENLQHSIVGAVFFVQKSAKKYGKRKIRYIEKRRGEVESENKKEKRRRERKTAGRLMPELKMLAAGKHCAL